MQSIFFFFRSLLAECRVEHAVEIVWFRGTGGGRTSPPSSRRCCSVLSLEKRDLWSMSSWQKLGNSTRLPPSPALLRYKVYGDGMYDHTPPPPTHAVLAPATAGCVQESVHGPRRKPRSSFTLTASDRLPGEWIADWRVISRSVGCIFFFFGRWRLWYVGNDARCCRRYCCADPPPLSFLVWSPCRSSSSRCPPQPRTPFPNVVRCHQASRKRKNETPKLLRGLSGENRSGLANFQSSSTVVDQAATWRRGEL